MGKKPYVITHQPKVQAPEQNVNFAGKGDVSREIFYTYSLIPDAVYPWDPSTLRTIRSGDPDFVPATVKRIVRTPAGTDLSFFYFAGLRYAPFPNGYHMPITVRMPWASGTRAEPNVEELVFEDEVPQHLQSMGWPGPFIPMVSDIALRVRRAGWLSDRFNREIFGDYQRGQEEREAKANASMKAEHDYRWDQEAAFLRGKAQPSGPEIDQIGAPRERPKKPFVLLGHNK